MGPATFRLNLLWEVWCDRGHLPNWWKGWSPYQWAPIERGVWIGSLAAAEHQNRTDEHNGSVQGERKGVALNTHGAKVRRLLVHFSSLVRNLLPEERLISNTWYP